VFALLAAWTDWLVSQSAGYFELAMTVDAVFRIYVTDIRVELFCLFMDS
jgi:hypothetical protein